MGRSIPRSLCSLTAVVCLLSGRVQGEPKRKSITTHLVAKWSNTPLLLEATEFLASESPDFFWGFIEAVNSVGEESIRYKTDREKHELVQELAARFLTPAQVDLLKFSLSLRTESPRLEMYRQVASDRGVTNLTATPSCQGLGVVFDHNGQLTCNLPTLIKDGKPTTTYTADHVYPGQKLDSVPTVVLYGEVGSSGFAKAHNQMVELAEKGEVRYVLRPLVNEGEGKVRLSGYGVELQIKSTEYKAQDDTNLKADDGDDGENGLGGEDLGDVEGFVFSKLKQRFPNKLEKFEEMKQHLLDMNNDMAPMKVWQLQDLSLQAAERIMKSPALERLEVMGDLASNFPSHARSLTRIAVRKEMKKEVKKNSEIFYSNLNLQPSDAALFVNGLHFDMEYTDIFTILDTLRQEERVLSGLGRLGLDNKQTSSLISLDLGGGGVRQTAYGVDIRDSAIHWINDIEKDKLYKGWPNSVQELLRPTFPGMLRSIRKNFFNLVIIFQPSSTTSKPILKLIESFYIHRAPTRIGLVLAGIPTDTGRTGENNVDVALNNAFNYIVSNKQAYDALAFFTDVWSQTIDSDPEDSVSGGAGLRLEDVKEAFLDNFGSDVKLADVFGEDSEYDVGRELAAEFVQKTGLTKLPQVLVNGVPMEEKQLNEEDFEEQLLTILMKETQAVQKAVYRNQLTDSMDVLDHLMSRENIMPRLNQRILTSADTQVLNMAGNQLQQLQTSSFSLLDKRSMSATMIKHLHYLVGKDSSKASKLRMMTVWVTGSLDSAMGRSVGRAAVQYVKTTNQMRLAFIHTTGSSPGLISRAVEAAAKYMSPSAAAVFVGKILKEDTAAKLEKGEKKIEDYDIPGVDMSQFMEKLNGLNLDMFPVHQIYSRTVLGLKTTDVAVVANGRIVGPLKPNEAFNLDDFELLEKLTMSQYGDKLLTAIYNNLDVQREDISDVALVAGGLLSSRTSANTAKVASSARQTITFKSDEHSVIKLEPRYPDRPSFDLVAVVDPISRGSQKLTPVVAVLSQVLNARVRVFLNCVDKHSEMPNKSYFKMVLEPWLVFGASGELGAGPRAAWHTVPHQPILTQNYHVSDNWLVEPTKSIYDLDNIKLEDIETGVNSEWELGSLLVEGHCFEAGTGNPPRGLQLVLGSKSNPNQTDTIVMANLGYLQLKAEPGAWHLNLREGRSSQIYEITSHENTDSLSGATDITVLVNSFQSRILKLKVSKKPHMRHEELLPSDKSGSNVEDSGIWSSIKSTFSGAESAVGKGDDEGLNIFCLATGHLYERLLKIMMLSVMKTTKTPVKFWILKNFLSPNLKDFIPEYAERYGFQYEYVQYKWPRWLNQQSEKQRTIWGYKILFLDVLFPLNLKKIIFVDTDQIVRTDLTELRDLDLGGAPYGYTPFCDSNKDMEGFRFWKQGYWRNHLAGRKYHISAIYVVDLVKFRQIAAGDRLRGQYQALSQDPNSLANLDQDLPNNMIHQVPIKSLPQEWLWCETWCSTDELKKAKSIDLCNNPLTKEPKLSAARRIVTEWSEYDEEMQRLGQKIAKDKTEVKNGGKVAELVVTPSSERENRDEL